VLSLWSYYAVRSAESEVTIKPCIVVCLIVAGCGAAKEGGLTVTDLRLDESAVPLPFVVALRKGSDEPVEIQGVSVNVTRKTLISRSQEAERVPGGFDFHVEHDPNHPTKVPANGDGVACGFLVWELPPDPPPMIAVVICDFRVHANGKTLTSEPITLVFQSREGLLELADGPLAEEQARRVLEVLSGLPGRKSARFGKLAQQLRDQGAANED
jgi:hypothetical protein